MLRLKDKTIVMMVPKSSVTPSDIVLGEITFSISIEEEESDQELTMCFVEAPRIEMPRARK